MSGERPTEGLVVARLGLETGLGVARVVSGPWLAEEVAVARRRWRKGTARTCVHRRGPVPAPATTYLVGGRLTCAPCLPPTVDETAGACEVCQQPEAEHRQVVTVAARLMAVVRHCRGCEPRVLRVLSREEVLAEGAGDA